MNVQIAQNIMNDNEYKTCDKCCYDILDDEGDVMDHECAYPFSEGDTYYTIEKAMSDAEYNLLVSNGENPQRYEVVTSCWDDVSEEMYDENPHMYMTSSLNNANYLLRKYNNER
jgi:hypothetical protein